jgi:hypothetical protein
VERSSKEERLIAKQNLRKLIEINNNIIETTKTTTTSSTNSGNVTT